MMLRALADFTVELDGELVFIEKGRDQVSSDWAGLKDCRHLFEPVAGAGRHGDRSQCRAYDGMGRLYEQRDVKRGR
jgi:hypothetical protein